MNSKLRFLLALAIGVAILKSVAAEASARGPSITPNEAQHLRHQVQQYHQMQRIAGAEGNISRAEYARLKNQQQQIRRMIQTARTN